MVRGLTVDLWSDDRGKLLWYTAKSIKEFARLSRCRRVKITRDVRVAWLVRSKSGRYWKHKSRRIFCEGFLCYANMCARCTRAVFVHVPSAEVDLERELDSELAIERFSPFSPPRAPHPLLHILLVVELLRRIIIPRENAPFLAASCLSLPCLCLPLSLRGPIRINRTSCAWVRGKLFHWWWMVQWGCLR